MVKSISKLVGARAFVADLRAQVIGAPKNSSNAPQICPNAVEPAFVIDGHFGQMEEYCKVDREVESAPRYAWRATI